MSGELRLIGFGGDLSSEKVASPCLLELHSKKAGHVVSASCLEKDFSKEASKGLRTLPSLFLTPPISLLKSILKSLSSCFKLKVSSRAFSRQGRKRMKLFDKTHKVALAVSFLLCSFEIPVNCMAIAALFDGDDACGDDNFDLGGAFFTPRKGSLPSLS